MKTIILSLLSLVFLSGCGPYSYTKPLVEADEYKINQDLLGTWLPPEEEGKEEPPLMIYKFSDTEYLFTTGSDLKVSGFRAYEIEFKEKKYLQVESIFWDLDKVSTVGGNNFFILQYSLSGDNLKLHILFPTVENENNPANDIQREFKEFVTLKRQIDQ